MQIYQYKYNPYKYKYNTNTIRANTIQIIIQKYNTKKSSIFCWKRLFHYGWLVFLSEQEECNLGIYIKFHSRYIPEIIESRRSDYINAKKILLQENLP